MAKYCWALIGGTIALLLCRASDIAFIQFYGGLAAMFWIMGVAVWGNFNSRRAMFPWGHPPEDPPRKYDR